jgi:hypothetical protein
MSRSLEPNNDSGFLYRNVYYGLVGNGNDKGVSDLPLPNAKYCTIEILAAGAGGGAGTVQNLPDSGGHLPYPRFPEGTFVAFGGGGGSYIYKYKFPVNTGKIFSYGLRGSGTGGFYNPYLGYGGGSGSPVPVAILYYNDYPIPYTQTPILQINDNPNPNTPTSLDGEATEGFGPWAWINYGGYGPDQCSKGGTASFLTSVGPKDFTVQGTNGNAASGGIPGLTLPDYFSGGYGVGGGPTPDGINVYGQSGTAGAIAFTYYSF